MNRFAHDIEATITAEKSVSREELERLAEEILDVLIESTKLVAMGPAVSADFGQSSISVLVTVEASSPSEVSEKKRSVEALIEKTANSFRLTNSSTSSTVLVGA